MKKAHLFPAFLTHPRGASGFGAMVLALGLAHCRTPEAPAVSPKPTVEPVRLAEEPWDVEIFPGETVGFSEGRPAWAVLVHPGFPGRLMSEADLLSGWQELGWTAQSDCRWLPTVAQRFQSSSARVFEIGTTLEKPQSAAGKVFFFMSRETREVVGFGALGAAGTASCRFDPSEVFLSAGTGAQRIEWKSSLPESESNEVRLNLPGQGVLRLEGNAEIAGDMLRLGRMPSWIFDIEAGSLGSFIDNDLFRPTLGVRENAGAVEYMATTFLIGLGGLSMSLDEGSYVAAFLRNGGSGVCLSEFTITANRETTVTCDWLQGSERGNRPWFRLDSIIPKPEFVRRRSVESFLNERSQFVQEPRGGIAEEPGDATILPATGTQDPEALCRRVSALSNSNREGVGFSESDLRRGITPFLTTVALSAAPIPSSDWRTSFTFLGNGAEVRIRGMRPGSQVIMEMPAQQKLRASLFVPPGNPTTQGALLVNGKVIRNFSVARPSLWNSTVYEIEEPLPYREDFEVSVCAWGVSFLPEFLYGARGILPFASSRPVCVDVDGDGQCGRQSF